MALATEQVAAKTPLTKEERMVIVASSVGTVFEWYDFYLYATLAPFFATLFFPKGNDTAALLSAFDLDPSLVHREFDLRRGPPADLCHHRLVGPHHHGDPAPPAGPGSWW